MLNYIFSKHYMNSYNIGLKTKYLRTSRPKFELITFFLNIQTQLCKSQDTSRLLYMKYILYLGKKCRYSLRFYVRVYIFMCDSHIKNVIVYERRNSSSKKNILLGPLDYLKCFGGLYLAACAMIMAVAVKVCWLFLRCLWCYDNIILFRKCFCSAVVSWVTLHYLIKFCVYPFCWKLLYRWSVSFFGLLRCLCAHLNNVLTQFLLWVIGRGDSCSNWLKFLKCKESCSAS